MNTKITDAASVLRYAAAVLEMWEGDPNETNYMGDFKDACTILELLAQHAPPTQAMNHELWALHLQGPDDVHAAPSKAHAEAAATAWAAFEADRTDRHEHDPKVEAVVTPWPYSAESHAAGVADFIPNWLLPRWQVDALEGKAVRSAQAVDLGQFAYSVKRSKCCLENHLRGAPEVIAREIADCNRLLALIDGKAVQP